MQERCLVQLRQLRNWQQRARLLLLLPLLRIFLPVSEILRSGITMKGSKIPLLLCKLPSVLFSTKATPRTNTCFVTCLRSAAESQLTPASVLSLHLQRLIFPFPLYLLSNWVFFLPLWIEASFFPSTLALCPAFTVSDSCPISSQRWCLHLTLSYSPFQGLRSRSGEASQASCLYSPLSNPLNRFDTLQNQKPQRETEIQYKSSKNAAETTGKIPLSPTASLPWPLALAVPTSSTSMLPGAMFWCTSTAIPQWFLYLSLEKSSGWVLQCESFPTIANNNDLTVRTHKITVLIIIYLKVVLGGFLEGDSWLVLLKLIFLYI